MIQIPLNSYSLPYRVVFEFWCGCMYLWDMGRSWLLPHSCCDEVTVVWFQRDLCFDFLDEKWKGIFIGQINGIAPPNLKEPPRLIITWHVRDSALFLGQPAVVSTEWRRKVESAFFIWLKLPPPTTTRQLDPFLCFPLHYKPHYTGTCLIEAVNRSPSVNQPCAPSCWCWLFVDA